MQVIGISRLYAQAEKQEKQASALRALAARLAHLKAKNIEELEAALGVKSAGDMLHLSLAHSGLSVSLRYDTEADVLLIVDVSTTGAMK